MGHKARSCLANKDGRREMRIPEVPTTGLIVCVIIDFSVIYVTEDRIPDWIFWGIMIAALLKIIALAGRAMGPEV